MGYATKSKKKLKEIAIRNKEHTKRRLIQRYGVDFTNKDIQNMCNLIQRKKKYIPVKLCSHEKTCYVLYNGKWFKVVYSYETKTLKTALRLKDHDTNKLLKMMSV